MINHLAFFVKHYLTKFGIAHEEGQGLVEYALIILLIAVAVITTVGIFGTQVRDLYQSVVDQFESF